MDVINVAAAFLLCDSIPKIFNSMNELTLTSWLHFTPDELLEFMPKVLDRIQVRRFRRGVPPVNTLFLEEFTSKS